MDHGKHMHVMHKHMCTQYNTTGKLLGPTPNLHILCFHKTKLHILSPLSSSWASGISHWSCALSGAKQSSGFDIGVFAKSSAVFPFLESATISLFCAHGNALVRYIYTYYVYMTFNLVFTYVCSAPMVTRLSAFQFTKVCALCTLLNPLKPSVYIHMMYTWYSI